MKDQRIVKAALYLEYIALNMRHWAEEPKGSNMPSKLMKAVINPPDWAPHTTSVWTLTQLQAWYDFYGPWASMAGDVWKPQSTLLCPDRYEVKFVKHNPGA